MTSSLMLRGLYRIRERVSNEIFRVIVLSQDVIKMSDVFVRCFAVGTFLYYPFSFIRNVLQLAARG